MNSLSIRNIYFFGFAAVFILACMASIYLQSWLLIGVPFAVLALVWLLHHLQYAFYVLLASIPWSIEWKFSNGLATDLPDEPLMVFVSFAALAYAAFNYKKIKSSFKWHPLLFILLLQTIWTFVTVFYSANPILSLKYFVAKSWYLLAFIAAAIIVFQKEERLKKAALILTISMVANAALAIVRHSFDGFTFASINDNLYPFFRNHVNYSSLLAFVTPVLFASLYFTKNKSHRRWLKLALFLTFAALVFAYSRGAWLALIAGGITYWLLKKRMLFFAYTSFIVILLAAVYWLQNDNRYLKFAHDYNTTVWHSDFSDHIIATYKLKDVSNAERFYRWVAGVKMIQDKPILGFGPNTFSSTYKTYTSPAFKTWVSDNKDRSTVHNYFLLIFIEQGLPGFLLLLILFGYLFYVAQRVYINSKDKLWKTTAIVSSIILVMIATVNFLSDMIEADKVGSIFYLCIAALIVADWKTKKSIS